MKETFAFRLDQETSQLLGFLARTSYRSRAGVIRWLIKFAAKNPKFLYPQMDFPIDDPGTDVAGNFVDTKITEEK